MISRPKPRLVQGVGVNDADYPISTSQYVGGKRVHTWMCPFYKEWRGILTRSYSKRFHKTNETYIGCSVADEWHSFKAFKAWMILQPWEGKHLDKDLLFLGNKVYSPETCVFVPSRVNLLFSGNNKARGETPLGVNYNKRDNTYHARVCYFNETLGKSVLRHIGYYSCAQEAHEAYRMEKARIVMDVALNQEDERVKDALLERSDTLLDMTRVIGWI